MASVRPAEPDRRCHDDSTLAFLLTTRAGIATPIGLDWPADPTISLAAANIFGLSMTARWRMTTHLGVSSILLGKDCPLRLLHSLALALTLAIAAPLPSAAQESSAGFPFAQVWGGQVQPPHASPITPLTSFAGPGLSRPAPPGRAPAPVLSFFPDLRQHRDSGLGPATPLFAFDRAQFFMPYRNDNLRLPAETLETWRTSALPFKLAGGYATPGDTYESLAQWTLRRPEGYVRAFGNAAGTTSDSYETGDGERVPYEFRLNTQQIILGYTPSRKLEVFGVFLRNDIDDFATPSVALDNTETDRLVGRVGAELREGGLGFDRIRAELSIRDGERVNNNFELRSFAPGPGARRQQVENERRFIDAQILGDAAFGPLQNRFALSFGQEVRDGLRFTDSVATSSTPLLDSTSAVPFPDIQVLDLGARWEGAYSFRKTTHLKLGGQYRSVWAEARDADRVPDGPFGIVSPGLPASASNLYEFYYGATETNPRFDLFDARALVEQEIADSMSIFGEIGYFERAPDSKELFFAATAPVPQAQNRFIGNPGLDKERHTRIGMGLVSEGEEWIAFGRSRRSGSGLQWGAWRASVGVSYDRVSDFISKDRARGQSGVAATDGANVFRNVDADILRAEADLTWNLTPELSTRANLIYTYGANRDDDRPLYGIAPLEANLVLNWTDSLGDLGMYSLGSKLRLVADQNRVDDNPATGSGFDEGETSGFTVLDLYASLLLRDRIPLQIGIDNVFDADYAEHVPAKPQESARPSRISAPGRTFYLRTGFSF